MKTTIYMFSSSIQEFEDAIKSEKLEGEDPYQEVTPIEELPFEAKFFVQRRRTIPKWADFLEPFFVLDELGLENQTCSFLILIKTENRIFAVNKGFASHLLDKSKLENHFGLKICLNEINPDSIKSIDSRNLETNTKHKRVVVSNNSILGNFEFNADEELLNMVSGIPLNLEFASSMSGADPVSFTKGEVSLIELEGICRSLLESFNKTDYQESFGFIDNIKPIEDENTKIELYAHLINDIENGNWDNFIISYPDIPELEMVEEWKITSNRFRDGINFDELNLENVITFFEEANIDEIDLTEIYVYCLDSNGNSIKGKQVLNDFINYEYDLEGRKYIYSRKQWYLIDSNFISKINSSISRIQLRHQNYLPNWPSNQNEEDYNEFVAISDNLKIGMDRKLCQIDGRGKIEICDLMENANTFIHVKKYKSSQSMGHLFNQGIVSAQVIKEDKERIIEWFNAEHPNINIENLINNERIDVVFAIGVDSEGENPINSLPFFSKVALYNAKKTIETSLGYGLTLYKIPLENH